MGFYSAFIVAERVEVRSRKAGAAAEAGVRWERFDLRYHDDRTGRDLRRRARTGADMNASIA